MAARQVSTSNWSDVAQSQLGENSTGGEKRGLWGPAGEVQRTAQCCLLLAQITTGLDSASGRGPGPWSQKEAAVKGSKYVKGASLKLPPSAGS